MDGDVGSAVRVEHLDGGSIWRALLARPRGNVLDKAMVEDLRATFAAARQADDLKAICLEGEGPNFSYGASVAEHQPDQVEAMLHGFHGLFRDIAAAGIVTLAAVRGQCLGGGLELVMFCHRVFAAPDAKLGQPEIKLGVFAPVASVVLPARVGRPAAEDLCLTGRTVDAEAAHRMGLVDEIAADPSAAALAYARQHFLPLSAAALRHANRALRADWLETVFRALEAAEARYLGELMETEDAVEGIEAFLAKRQPTWRNR